MKILRCYVEDRWCEADSGFAPLVNPCTEAEIARASGLLEFSNNGDRDLP